MNKEFKNEQHCKKYNCNRSISCEPKHHWRRANELAIHRGGYSRSSGSEAEAPKMRREKNRWGFLLRRCQDTYTLWKITYCLQFLRWLPRVFTKNPSYPAYVTEGNLVTFSLRFCSLDSPLRLPI